VVDSSSPGAFNRIVDGCDVISHPRAPPSDFDGLDPVFDVKYGAARDSEKRRGHVVDVYVDNRGAYAVPAGEFQDWKLTTSLAKR
jgi:hypothetical protein